MISRVVVLLVLIFSMNLAQGLCQNSITNRYQTLQLMRFDIGQGIVLPPEYISALKKHIIEDLGATGRFSKVVPQMEPPAKVGPRTLELFCSITEFQEGSQPNRQWIGMGVGNTVLQIHVKFLDPMMHKMVLERDVRGVLSGWSLVDRYTQSIEVTDRVAKSLSDLAKSQF
jgi:hypothetical protein